MVACEQVLVEAQARGFLAKLLPAGSFCSSPLARVIQGRVCLQGTPMVTQPTVTLSLTYDIIIHHPCKNELPYKEFWLPIFDSDVTKTKIDKLK